MSPRTLTSQSAAARTACRPAITPMKLAMVAPVVKPTSESGRCRMSSSQRPATSSIAAIEGVARRIPAFWSHALTSQSAPSAAGSVPPITQP